MKKHINNNFGFSIIEVLIGAIVFMIGFSLLITMLNNVFVKFSTKEMKQASDIASEQMYYSLYSHNTNNLDTIIVKSGISYKLIKNIKNENNLAKVTISVARAKTNKEIIKLYNEFIIPQKQ